MSEAVAVKKYVAELIGTFVLVFMGCGSAVLAGKDSLNFVGIGSVGISFAFGLSVLAMVYSIGGVSGCHINPAISINVCYGQNETEGHDSLHSNAMHRRHHRGGLPLCGCAW